MNKRPQVEEVRDVKPRSKRIGAKRKKGDALVFKTELSKYSDVLLVGLGADVRSIRRTRTDEMILELKHDKDARVPTIVWRKRYLARG